MTLRATPPTARLVSARNMDLAHVDAKLRSL